MDIEPKLYELIDQEKLSGFCNVSGDIFRRLYFQGLGALSQSLAGQKLHNGVMAMCITEGRVQDFNFDFDATFSMIASPKLKLITEITSHKGITASGSVFDQESPSFKVELKFDNQNEDLKSMLTQLFRLPIIPELAKPIKNYPEICDQDLNLCWLDFFGPGIGSGMYALSLLKEDQYDTKIEINDEENQIQIKTWSSYLPLR